MQTVGNGEPIKLKPKASGIELLTPREKEVTDLISEGMTSRQASEILCITTKTVEKHLENIKNKLKCRNKSNLIIFLRDLNEKE